MESIEMDEWMDEWMDERVNCVMGHGYRGCGQDATGRVLSSTFFQHMTKRDGS